MDGMSARRLKTISLFGLTLLLLFSSAAEADGDTWTFSAYDYTLKKFVTAGPFSTREQCNDERNGYLRNDNYRNVSDCV